MFKLTYLLILFGVSLTSSGMNGENSISAYAFEDLVFKKCKNPCQLKPRLGNPFTIEWEIKRMETESGNRNFVEIKLNGKEFGPLKIGSGQDGPFPFSQELAFNDHRFQLYSILSSVHARTSYSYYFRREGDTFYLLSSEPVLTLSYDYNAKDKKENERFYGIQGDGPDRYGRSQYRRTNYKLEGNRLIITEEDLLLK